MNRDYAKLLAAAGISNLGDAMAFVALPWVASLLTRDALLVAGAGLASRLPWLLFSLQAGLIADRFDRRRQMVWANGIRAATLAVFSVMVAFGLLNLPLLYAVGLVLGCCEVVFDNCTQTVVPAVVSEDRLESANGRIWAAQVLVNELAGRPLAGLAVGLALFAPFAIDATAALLSAGLVAVMSGSFRPQADPDLDRTRGWWRDIGAGLAWLWRHELLRTLAVMLGMLNGVVTGALSLFVLFVQDILGLGAVGFGVVQGLGAVGGLLGGLYAARVAKRAGPAGALLLTLAVPIVLFSGIAVTSSAVVVTVAFAVFGFNVMVWNTVTVSLRQRLVPDALLGRVNSAYRFFGWGMMPVGTLLVGGMVQVLEPAVGRSLALRSPFALCAAVYLAMLLWGARGVLARSGNRHELRT